MGLLDQFLWRGTVKYLIKSLKNIASLVHATSDDHLDVGILVPLRSFASNNIVLNVRDVLRRGTPGVLSTLAPNSKVSLSA